MSGSAGVRDATEPTDGRQSWRLSFHRLHKQGRPSEQQRASIGDPQARKELVCAHAKRSQVKLCQEPCLLPVNRINHAGQGEPNVALLRLKTSSLRQKQSRLNTLCHWTLWSLSPENGPIVLTLSFVGHDPTRTSIAEMGEHCTKLPMISTLGDTRREVIGPVFRLRINHYSPSAAFAAALSPVAALRDSFSAGAKRNGDDGKEEGHDLRPED